MLAAHRDAAGSDSNINRKLINKRAGAQFRIYDFQFGFDNPERGHVERDVKAFKAAVLFRLVALIQEGLTCVCRD